MGVIASLRSASLRFASLRFASLRFAPLRFASLRELCLRFQKTFFFYSRSASLHSFSSSLVVSRCKVAGKAQRSQFLTYFQSGYTPSVFVRSSRGASVARLALPPHILTDMWLRASRLGGVSCLASAFATATLTSLRSVRYPLAHSVRLRARSTSLSPHTLGVSLARRPTAPPVSLRSALLASGC